MSVVGSLWSVRTVAFQANQVLEIIWIVWLMSWVGASFWSDRAQKRAMTMETWTYRAGMIVGGILLVPWIGQLLEKKPIWEVGHAGMYVLAAVMLAGLSLTWWARIYLGPLWSSVITRKRDHQIIDTGPYAFVRHPIYCGMILALLGFALSGLLSGALVFIPVTVIFLRRVVREERIMMQLFPNQYPAYRRRTRRLIPLVW